MAICVSCRSTFDGRRRACTECGAPKVRGRTAVARRTRTREGHRNRRPTRSVDVERLSQTAVRLPVTDIEARRFPELCAQTGQPSTGEILVTRRFPVWALFSLLFGLIVGLLLFLVLQRTSPHPRLRLPAASSVSRRLRLVSALTAAGLVGGPLLLALALGDVNVLPIAIALLMFGGGVAGYVQMMDRWFPSVQVNAGVVVLENLHPRFVDALEQQEAEDAYPPFVNDSGEGDAASLPAQLRGFNWGAFLLTFIWGVRHRVYIALVVLVPLPLLGLVLALLLGARGNELAWKRRRWESIAAFRKAQRRWTIAGASIAGALMALLVAGMVVAAIQTEPETPTYTESTGEWLSIRSPDGSLAMQVPPDWVEDPRLHPEADIQASNASQEMYAIAFAHPKADFGPGATLETVAGLARAGFASALEDASIGIPETHEIGGFPAVTVVISGTADGVDITYRLTVVESQTRYVEVDAWTLTSGYEERRDALARIVGSVRTMSGVGAA